jgi:hypothetical protein
VRKPYRDSNRGRDADSDSYIDEGVFLGKDGKPSREKNLEWVTSPDEIAFIKPYMFSVFPAGTVPSQILGGSVESVATSGTGTGTAAGTVQGQQGPSMIPTSVIQIRSSISSHISQIFPLPFAVPLPPTPTTSLAAVISDDTSSITTAASAQPTAAQNATIRIPLSASLTKSPVYVITTPAEKNAAAMEGSSIWQFAMRSWADQVDELVLGGFYADALQLLDVIDDAALPDKVTHILFFDTRANWSMVQIGAKTHSHSRIERSLAIPRIQI